MMHTQFSSKWFKRQLNLASMYPELDLLAKAQEHAFLLVLHKSLLRGKKKNWLKW
jgi:hypothetical protein